MAEWGVFLCNCSQTLPIDSQQLTLSTPYVQFASHPDTDLLAFVEHVQQASCRHALISCCSNPLIYQKVLEAIETN